MFIIMVIVLTLFLQSCMLWDFVKPSGGIQTEIEVVAGDKNQEVATGAVIGTKETNNNTADAITQTYNNVNEAYPWWVVALLILGWVLPSPSQMWKGMVSLLPWKRRGQ